MFPALLPFLLPLLGDAVSAIFGGDDKPAGQVAATVATAAVQVASQIAGVPITDEASAQQAAAAIQADPAKLAEYQRAMNEKAIAAMAEETKRLALDNDDRSSARAQTVALAQAGSAAAWGAPIVSVVVLIGFFAVMVLLFATPQSDMPERTFNLLNMLFGALVLGFGQVTSYWLGSSAGSAAKDRLLRPQGGVSASVSVPLPGRKPAR